MLMEKEQRTADPGKLKQFLAAIILNLSAISYGTMVGWQSPAMPYLQSSDPPVGTEPMTDEEASWLSGVMCLSGMFMSLLIGLMTERLGRKMTGCLNAVPLTITWLLTAFATEPIYLFVARFFAGIGGGIALFLVPLYVSEIACDRIRGMLGSLLIFCLNIGILLSYVIGAFLSFRAFALANLVLPLLYLGLFVFLPETPVYLVRKNRLHEAVRSLMWLKSGHKPEVQRELARLQAEAKGLDACTRSIKLSDLFRDKATIKGLVISLGLFGGQQLCGIFAMISYTETIFGISGSSLSPNMSAIVVGAIQVFGSYLSTSLMERMGRRPLLLISCMGMCVCHLILGSFAYFQLLQYDVSAFGWIPVVALSMFMICYCLGMGPGPYVVTSEIFSRDISSLGTTVGLLFVWFMAFVVVKFFPSLVLAFGMHGCFFFFSGCCMATFFFTFFVIPETKSRPRQFIVDLLNGVPYSLEEVNYVSSKEESGKSLPNTDQA